MANTTADWYAHCLDDPRDAHTEWREYGVAVLPVGEYFEAVRLPGVLADAAAASDVTAVVNHALSELLEGPVIHDTRGRNYYALVEPGTRERWRSRQARHPPASAPTGRASCTIQRARGERDGQAQRTATGQAVDTALPAVEPRRKPADAAAVDSATATATAPAGQEVNREVCRRALTTMGLLREPWLEKAFDDVDREAFVPQAVWLPVRDDEGLWQFVDREEEPEAWRRAVWNPHRSVVTQLNDGEIPSGPASGDFTSSVSALDIVLRKLHHLDLKPQSRVLEIGYGSGYHTALLCERVGSEQVVAIEVDEELARMGAANLKATGYHPELVVGDGLQGVPGGDLFERIVNTASLRRVPYAWIEQSRRGGVILTPFGTAYSNAGLLRLRVDTTGTRAQGWFVGESSYMWIRSERPTVDLRVPGESTRRRSPIDPAQVLDGGYLQDFAIGLQVPDVSSSHRGEGDARRVQFVDEAGTSATIVNYGDWWEEDAVRAWGPRDLWAEVTAAYTWYECQGRPHITRFGLTVDGGGQYTWLDEPRRLVGS
ncbi:hypothetical protein OG765_37070 [Streptomyces sp. NBC_00555]|uniref:protein-L-isoaspartate O-methyltransferase family protein n=1 Tax=Streptomyces sp. NBC_00555 TaxID=2903662 RepID=UPI00225AB8E4|nr:rRNA adenine N-6-methyltransferase family protein [Streptomyces sp. NBC_00555]MCX5014874.1 hypothetical protein [Streptomyces sp. NBC_00555]MCX5016537.1 hypothetical protein [Streptomyces sp. NBC_00555]